jgi:hypothetical protein
MINKTPLFFADLATMKASLDARGGSSSVEAVAWFSSYGTHIWSVSIYKLQATAQTTAQTTAQATAQTLTAAMPEHISKHP